MCGGESWIWKLSVLFMLILIPNNNYLNKCSVQGVSCYRDPMFYQHYIWAHLIGVHNTYGWNKSSLDVLTWYFWKGTRDFSMKGTYTISRGQIKWLNLPINMSTLRDGLAPKTALQYKLVSPKCGTLVYKNEQGYSKMALFVILNLAEWQVIFSTPTRARPRRKNTTPPRTSMASNLKFLLPW